MAKKNDVESMKQEAERRQDNLAADVDELLDRINPKNALERWKNELTGKGANFAGSADGNDSTALIAVIAGGAVGAAALIGGSIALGVTAKKRVQRKKETRFSEAVAKMVAARESAGRVR